MRNKKMQLTEDLCKAALNVVISKGKGNPFT